MTREYPGPVRNEMMPCKGYVRITAGDHLGKIAMHDAEAARKTRHFRCEQSLGCGLAKQLVGGSTALGATIARVRQRKPRASPSHVPNAINPNPLRFSSK